MPLIDSESRQYSGQSIVGVVWGKAIPPCRRFIYSESRQYLGQRHFRHGSGCSTVGSGNARTWAKLFLLPPVPGETHCGHGYDFV